MSDNSIPIYYDKFSKSPISYNSQFTDELVQRWISFTGVRPTSQLTYTKALKQLFKYFKENNIINPTRDDLLDWKSQLSDRLKPSSIQLYLVATKLFFRFLEQEGIYKNISDNIKGTKLDHEHKKDALTIKH